VSCTNTGGQRGFETAMNKMQLVGSKSCGPLNALTFDFNTDNMQSAIHSAQSTKQFDCGNCARTVSEVNNNGFRISHHRQSGNESINPSETIRIRRSASRNSGWFRACHCSNLMPVVLELAD
jgi:hypothetical protein